MARHDAKGDRLGALLGPRLAQLLAEGATHHLRESARYRADIIAEGLNEFFRGMSREKKNNTSGLWRLFMGHEATPAEIESVLRFIHSGQGELSELLNTLGIAQGVSTSILGALQNALAPVNQDLIKGQPNSLLDPGSMARAYVAGYVSQDEYLTEVAKSGINNNRAVILEQLSHLFPGLGELLTLWRRGHIDEAQVKTALDRQQIPGQWQNVLVELRKELLSVPDAALAVLRGHISEGEGESVAERQGVSAQDFQTIVYNTGEPPGMMQMLEAYRRGFVDEQELQKSIRQSRIRDEWFPVVKKLRFTPASSADAVNGLVQHHIDAARAKKIWEQNGLEPGDFQFVYENAGEPAANMQMLELYNRGKATKAEVEQSIREGHTKDKYIPHIFALHVKLPEVRQIINMIGTGAITQARGSELLHQQGFEDDVAAGLVKSATSGQMVREKELAQSQITALYHDNAIDEQQALAFLKIIGVHESTGKFILRLVDLKRDNTLKETAATTLRSQYIGHAMHEDEVIPALQGFGFSTEHIAYLLKLWNIERAGNHRKLTYEQITKANSAGVLSDEQAEAKLMELGYTREDARIILDSEAKRTHPAP